MSQETSPKQVVSVVEEIQRKDDPFVKQIKRYQSSKLTQFLNVFYSFIVGILCAVASKRYLRFPKSLGTLIGVVSYLYNKNASQ